MFLIDINQFMPHGDGVKIITCGDGNNFLRGVQEVKIRGIRQ
ncbi:hypothetical protein CIT292_09251 [Citrobacter youngae ATCC 29220]|uniref:Uncharacterized protein n=1 Tax=Citrobacter youngae ATCC 29220 TaxID=500640 RepID=D4BEN8_9ENTR|nr:hypothetical protein CIT292_09251 [Citrobacter youngae ATCC 29220]